VLDWRLLAVIAAGSALGGVLRYLVGLALVQRFGAAFPLGTLTVNVTGSFLIGVAIELSQTRLFGGWPYWRPFAATGVLGGYTTFSTFIFETLTFIGDNSPLLAVGYACTSLAVGLAAAYGGIVAVRILLLH
jgi:CrcB protein